MRISWLRRSIMSVASFLVLPLVPALAGPADTSASLSDPETGAIEVDTIETADELAIAMGESRGSFVLHERLYLVAEGQDPVIVEAGVTGHSAIKWSTDGAFLAWTRIDPLDPNNAQANTLNILNTQTGERWRIRDTENGFGHQLFAVGDHLVAFVAGRPAALTAFRKIDLAQFGEDPLADGAVGPVVNVALPDGAAGDGSSMHDLWIDADLEWLDAVDGHLYVQRSQRSVLLYRYEPQLWQVDLDGTASFMFNECPHPEEGCLSNYGLVSLKVAPDRSHVAYQGGTRSGCDEWTQIVLTPIDSFDPVELTGIPTKADTSVVTLHQLDWIDESTMRIVVSAHELRSGDERCTYPQVTAPTAYLCSVDGECQPTGETRSLRFPNASGDVVFVENDPSYGYERLMTIEWADGSSQRIIAYLNTWQWGSAR